MKRLRDRMPRYLFGKFQMTATVVFVALFSLVFIMARLPLSNNIWLQLDVVSFFKYLLIYFSACLLFVIASRRLMYFKGKAWKLTIFGYVIWCLVEILVVSLFYNISTIWALNRGILVNGEVGATTRFINTLVCNIAAMGLPYLIAAMYFTIAQQNNAIRLLNYGSVVGDTPVQAHEEKRFTLFDNSGALKFSSRIDNVYLVESDDNYVQISYADFDGRLKKYMVRCRLKTVEDNFLDSDMVRCHRKYIVNITKVKVLKAEGSGYSVDFGIEGTAPIPISKTYEQAVLARFNSR